MPLITVRNKELKRFNPSQAIAFQRGYQRLAARTKPREDGYARSRSLRPRHVSVKIGDPPRNAIRPVEEGERTRRRGRQFRLNERKIRAGKHHHLHPVAALLLQETREC